MEAQSPNPSGGDWRCGAGPDKRAKQIQRVGRTKMGNLGPRTTLGSGPHAIWQSCSDCEMAAWMPTRQCDQQQVRLTAKRVPDGPDQGHSECLGEKRAGWNRSSATRERYAHRARGAPEQSRATG